MHQKCSMVGSRSKGEGRAMNSQAIHISYDKSCKAMEIIQLMSCASLMKKWNWRLQLHYAFMLAMLMMKKSFP